MIQVDAAISHYQRQIKPNSVFRSERGNPMLVGWLENSVAPLVEHWLDDSRFRQMATFSLSRLARPNDSQEYAAFLAVHLGITNLASSIQRLIELPEVQPVLLAKFGYQQWARRCFGDTPEIWIASTLKRLTSLSQLAAASLVSENDFFSPTAGLYADRQPRIQLQHSPTNSSFRLNLPGDMIFWCLQVRLEYFCDELHRLRIAITSLPSDTAKASLIQDVADRDSELRRAERDFAKTVQSSDQRQKCDSVSTLIQAYTATRKQDMRDWLGLNSTVQHSHLSFYFEINREGGTAVTDHVLAALEVTQRNLDTPKSREEWIDELKESHRILMVDGGDEIYFNGELIISHGATEDSGKQLGVAQVEFLTKLIEFAKDGKSISREDLRPIRSKKNEQGRELFSEMATPKALRDRRSKLKNILSQELDMDILSEGHGRYRLNIPPGEIHILYSSEE